MAEESNDASSIYIYIHYQEGNIALAKGGNRCVLREAQRCGAMKN